uniref:Putative secreted protein n=1 Tax=Ixodes ricinus TaxID=34613 RepID=A0A090X9L0_IXORI
MIVLNILFVISSLAYGTPLSLNTDVDETNNIESKIVSRDIKGQRPMSNSRFLQLYVYYSPQLKKHLEGKGQRVKEYLPKFVEEVNQELGTGNDILGVQFALAGFSMWHEAHRAHAPDKKFLDLDLLLAILGVYARRLEKTWHKEHHHSRIRALLFLTPEKIKHVNTEAMQIDVAEQIGAICSKNVFVAAATDNPGSFTGVQSAAHQLSVLHRKPKCLEPTPPRNVESNAIMK